MRKKNAGERRVLALLLVLGVLAGALAPATPAAAQQGDRLPRFVAADCPFDHAADPSIVCGYLLVPENRHVPDSAVIRLAVAILPARSATPAPDPVIYLEGGPGGAPLAFPEDWFTSPIRDTRDLILLDQRGTGYSEPLLDCPEADALVLDTLDDPLSLQEAQLMSAEVMLTCRARLAAEGVDLTAYDSAANAADVDDLRTVLGYDEWNLYGVSYGTRLALTILRDYPDGVRSVVLDSVYPPQAMGYIELAANGLRAFNELFDGCAADAACSAAYPTLEEDFYAVREQLNQEPVAMQAVHPFSGETYTVLLTGDVVLATLFSSLYVSDLIPALPLLIEQLKDGEYQIFATIALALAVQGEYIAEGMFYSVECREELPFNDYDTFVTESERVPVVSEYMLAQPDYLICADWGAGAAPEVETAPVSSDVPTLILAGEYDPITPPVWGREAGETLSSSYFYEFPGLGHGVTFSACPEDIMLDFLADPTTAPDTACLATMGPPEFVVQ